MASPYSNLESRAFWRSGAVEQHPFELDIYRKKFPLNRDDKIATAGSCFAQHISTRLTAHGFNVIDTEPAPPNLTIEMAKKYGFRQYSARYGNIYTTRQLYQLAQEAENVRFPIDYV